MKVLILSWEFPPHVVGGLGAHVAALAPALARQGVEVDVVTPRKKGGASDEVIASSHKPLSTPLRSGDLRLAMTNGRATVHRVETPEMPGVDFFTHVKQSNNLLAQYAQTLWDMRGGFDLIHAHDWLVAFTGVTLKHSRKTPLVATVHATERGRGRGSLAGETAIAINGTEWWLTYEAWRVITTSGFMADEVKNYFGAPADKVDIVPNGIDTVPLDAMDGQDFTAFRAQWALPQERIIFFVGRMQNEKGAQLIVEAVPQILAQVPDAKFILAGTGSMVEPLRARVNALGLNDKVLVAGFISDEARDQLFKVAEVAVFPSLYEPFGIVALEAMAAKCPVVVSRVGGLQEVVSAHETGIVVEPDNIASLAWGILHTLQNPDWAQARVANAYRVVREEFNWDLVAQKTKKVYERVAEERRKVVW